MLALAAAIMFFIACAKVKAGTDDPLFWLYLGLGLWSLHFFADPYLAPYYPRRRRVP
jgi:hypothetical protein